MEDPVQVSERIEWELRDVLREFDAPPLSGIPGPYRDAIAEFLLRKGKRLRPALFVLSYSGYATEAASNLYRSAVGIELLHDFTLIHDDIIDRSTVRRDGPAMHALLQDKLNGQSGRKFSGENLAIVVGDMMYALGIRLFLSVDETAEKKQAALECLTQAAVFTACGEMKELLDAIEPLDRLTAEGIAETCQWKTAYYSFACPLVTGALLGGATTDDRDALLNYGLSIGLAYQIQDDALELLDGHAAGAHDGDHADLRAGTRTLPLWYAVHHASPRDRTRLTAIVDGGKPSRRDLETARDIIVRSGGVDYALNEVSLRLDEGRRALDSLRMNETCREALWRQTVGLLNAPDEQTRPQEVAR